MEHAAAKSPAIVEICPSCGQVTGQHTDQVVALMMQVRKLLDVRPDQLHAVHIDYVDSEGAKASYVIRANIREVAGGVQ